MTNDDYQEIAFECLLAGLSFDDAVEFFEKKLKLESAKEFIEKSEAYGDYYNKG